MSAFEGQGEDKCTNQVYLHLPLSSLQGFAALHSVLYKSEPILDFHATAPCLIIMFQAPQPHIRSS